MPMVGKKCSVRVAPLHETVSSSMVRQFVMKAKGNCLKRASSIGEEDLWETFVKKKLAKKDYKKNMAATKAIFRLFYEQVFQTNAIKSDTTKDTTNSGTLNVTTLLPLTPKRKVVRQVSSDAERSDIQEVRVLRNSKKIVSTPPPSHKEAMSSIRHSTDDENAVANPVIKMGKSEGSNAQPGILKRKLQKKQIDVGLTLSLRPKCRILYLEASEARREKYADTFYKDISRYGSLHENVEKQDAPSEKTVEGSEQKEGARNADPDPVPSTSRLRKGKCSQNFKEDDLSLREDNTKVSNSKDEEKMLSMHEHVKRIKELTDASLQKGGTSRNPGRSRLKKEGDRKGLSRRSKRTAKSYFEKSGSELSDGDSGELAEKRQFGDVKAKDRSRGNSSEGSQRSTRRKQANSEAATSDSDSSGPTMRKLEKRVEKEKGQMKLSSEPDSRITRSSGLAKLHIVKSDTDSGHSDSEEPAEKRQYENAKKNDRSVRKSSEASRRNTRRKQANSEAATSDSDSSGPTVRKPEKRVEKEKGQFNISSEPGSRVTRSGSGRAKLHILESDSDSDGPAEKRHSEDAKKNDRSVKKSSEASRRNTRRKQSNSEVATSDSDSSGPTVRKPSEKIVEKEKGQLNISSEPGSRITRSSGHAKLHFVKPDTDSDEPAEERQFEDAKTKNRSREKSAEFRRNTRRTQTISEAATSDSDSSVPAVRKPSERRVEKGKGQLEISSEPGSRVTRSSGHAQLHVAKPDSDSNHSDSDDPAEKRQFEDAKTNDRSAGTRSETSRRNARRKQTNSEAATSDSDSSVPAVRKPSQRRVGKEKGHLEISSKPGSRMTRSSGHAQLHVAKSDSDSNHSDSDEPAEKRQFEDAKTHDRSVGTRSETSRRNARRKQTNSEVATSDSDSSVPAVRKPSERRVEKEKGHLEISSEPGSRITRSSGHAQLHVVKPDSDSNHSDSDEPAEKRQFEDAKTNDRSAGTRSETSRRNTRKKQTNSEAATSDSDSSGPTVRKPSEKRVEKGQMNISSEPGSRITRSSGYAKLHVVKSDSDSGHSDSDEPAEKRPLGNAMTDRSAGKSSEVSRQFTKRTTRSDRPEVKKTSEETVEEENGQMNNSAEAGSRITRSSASATSFLGKIAPADASEKELNVPNEREEESSNSSDDESHKSTVDKTIIRRQRRHTTKSGGKSEKSGVETSDSGSDGRKEKRPPVKAKNIKGNCSSNVNLRATSSRNSIGLLEGVASDSSDIESDGYTKKKPEKTTTRERSRLSKYSVRNDNGSEGKSSSSETDPSDSDDYIMESGYEELSDVEAKRPKRNTQEGVAVRRSSRVDPDVDYRNSESDSNETGEDSPISKRERKLQEEEEEYSVTRKTCSGSSKIDDDIDKKIYLKRRRGGVNLQLASSVEGSPMKIATGVQTDSFSSVPTGYRGSDRSRKSAAEANITHSKKTPKYAVVLLEKYKSSPSKLKKYDKWKGLGKRGKSHNNGNTSKHSDDEAGDESSKKQPLKLTLRSLKKGKHERYWTSNIESCSENSEGTDNEGSDDGDSVSSFTVAKSTWKEKLRKRDRSRKCDTEDTSNLDEDIDDGSDMEQSAKKQLKDGPKVSKIRLRKLRKSGIEGYGFFKDVSDEENDDTCETGKHSKKLKRDGKKIDGKHGKRKKREIESSNTCSSNDGSSSESFPVHLHKGSAVKSGKIQNTEDIAVERLDKLKKHDVKFSGSDKYGSSNFRVAHSTPVQLPNVSKSAGEKEPNRSYFEVEEEICDGSTPTKPVSKHQKPEKTVKVNKEQLVRSSRYNRLESVSSSNSETYANSSAKMSLDKKRTRNLSNREVISPRKIYPLRGNRMVLDRELENTSINISMRSSRSVTFNSNEDLDEEVQALRVLPTKKSKRSAELFNVEDVRKMHESTKDNDGGSDQAELLATESEGESDKCGQKEMKKPILSTSLGKGVRRSEGNTALAGNLDKYRNAVGKYSGMRHKSMAASDPLLSQKSTSKDSETASKRKASRGRRKQVLPVDSDDEYFEGSWDQSPEIKNLGAKKYSLRPVFGRGDATADKMVRKRVGEDEATSNSDDTDVMPELVPIPTEESVDVEASREVQGSITVQTGTQSDLPEVYIQETDVPDIAALEIIKDTEHQGSEVTEDGDVKSGSDIAEMTSREPEVQDDGEASKTVTIKAKIDARDFLPSLTDDDDSQSAKLDAVESDSESIGAICRFIQETEPASAPTSFQGAIGASATQKSDENLDPVDNLDGQGKDIPRAAAEKPTEDDCVILPDFQESNVPQVADDVPSVQNCDIDEADERTDQQNDTKDELTDPQNDTKDELTDQQNNSKDVLPDEQNGTKDELTVQQSNTKDELTEPQATANLESTDATSETGKVDPIPNSERDKFTDVEIIVNVDENRALPENKETEMPTDSEAVALKSQADTIVIDANKDCNASAVPEKKVDDLTLCHSGEALQIIEEVADGSLITICDDDSIQDESEAIEKTEEAEGNGETGDLFELDDCWETCSEAEEVSDICDDESSNTQEATTSLVPQVDKQEMRKKEMKNFNRLKKLLVVSGIVFSPNSMFKDHDTIRTKSKKLLQALRKNGLRGKPSFKKCKAIRRLREIQKEAEESRSDKC